MKQIVEEAAREYWNSWLKSNPNIDKTRIVSLGFAFKAGRMAVKAIPVGER